MLLLARHKVTIHVLTTINSSSVAGVQLENICQEVTAGKLIAV